MAALQNGSFKQALITNGIVKAGAITTGGWTALSLGLTFALQSAFASTQKKAGRLGVMKALEELKDPAYYANEKQISFKSNPDNGHQGLNLGGVLKMSDFMNNLKNNSAF